MLRIRVAACSKESSAWFSNALQSRGIETTLERGSNPSAVVCYGYGFELGARPSLPVLNANAGASSKIAQLKLMRESGLQTVPFAETESDAARLRFPLLARINSDGNGKDIVPVFQAEEISWRIASGARFFSQYVPRAKEFRFWVYRERILATYTKVMRHPERYKGIGANTKDGFTHEFTDRSESPRNLWPLAINAVKAVGLDFGGVDVLLGQDGEAYLLEVNSAPGANGPRAVGLQHLADEVSQWYRSHS